MLDSKALKTSKNPKSSKISTNPKNPADSEISTSLEVPTNPKIRFTLISLFCEPMQAYLDCSMMWKAQNKGIVQFDYLNLRDFGIGPHKSVDDTPYGGGDGMLLRCEPVFAAIEYVKSTSPDAEVILPTPYGQLWTQDLVWQFANSAKDHVQNHAQNHPSTPHYIILCPHYEGYDQRILSIVDHKISLGRYILTGGELPALIVIDSVVRLIPGVLGGENSATVESFSDGDNIEYPQYTKPADFRGMTVPEILLSGNHGAIAKWRADHTTKSNY